MNKKFRYLYIEITNDCNLSCPFCPQNRKDQYLSFANFKIIIDKVKDFVETVYFHVLGEPSLHFEIDKFVHYASLNGLKSRITTNGINLENLKRINLQELNKISFSLQCLIQFSKEYQINKMKNIIAFLDDKPAPLGVDLRLWNNKNDPKIKELNKNIEEFLETSQVLKYPNIHLSIQDEFVWPNLNHKINTVKSSCLGGIKQLAILINGDIVLCCLDSSGHTKIGNIYNDDFQVLLESQFFNNIRLKSLNGEHYFDLCKRCSFRNRFKK